MTITGSNTTNFSFQKLGSNDSAGYSTINEVVDGIDTILNASDRLIKAAQTPTASYVITGDGSDWVSGLVVTNSITDLAVTTGKIAASAVTSAKIADDTIVNADVNSAAAIAYSKLNLALGIVNADISASAAIVDTKLATIATTGKVSNSATTATSANTASAIVARDSNGDFSARVITATTFSGSFSGGATTATTATNLAGGSGGSIPYQSASATTAMLSNGTAGQVLSSAGTTLAPTWITPTDANTASTIVKRDASGNFTAGTITAALTGTASTATTLITNSVLTAPIEVFATRAAMTGTVNYDVSTQAVLYANNNATANWTLNVRASSGVSLNTLLANNQAITIVLLNQNGSTAYYQSAMTIDGSSVTPKWSGTAPTAGNASATDIYTFNILKTASATYTVFASVGKWA